MLLLLIVNRSNTKGFYEAHYIYILYIYITPGCSPVDHYSQPVPCIVRSNHAHPTRTRPSCLRSMQHDTKRQPPHLALVTLFIRGQVPPHRFLLPPISCVASSPPPLGFHHQQGFTVRTTRCPDPVNASIPRGGWARGGRFNDNDSGRGCAVP
jgi:hypothetical protein